MRPSIDYQPWHLMKALPGGQIWKGVEPLPESERVPVEIGPDGYPADRESEDHRRLEQLQGSAPGKAR